MEKGRIKKGMKFRSSLLVSSLHLVIFPGITDWMGVKTTTEGNMAHYKIPYLVKSAAPVPKLHIIEDKKTI